MERRLSMSSRSPYNGTEIVARTPSGSASYGDAVAGSGVSASPAGAEMAAAAAGAAVSPPGREHPAAMANSRMGQPAANRILKGMIGRRGRRKKTAGSGGQKTGGK